MKTQEEKAAAFQALHAGEPFVIPNPWDAGSGRVLEALGFKALATTSSGFAFTLGRLDGHVTLDEVVSHVSSLTQVTDVPVSVDLENGYGAEPETAAHAVIRVGWRRRPERSVARSRTGTRAVTSMTWATRQSGSRPRLRQRTGTRYRSS
jgi:hypothetical protein